MKNIFKVLIISGLVVTGISSCVPKRKLDDVTANYDSEKAKSQELHSQNVKLEGEKNELDAKTLDLSKRLSYLKKGIPFFEKAVAIIQEKYPEKVEIIITENIPYNEYISIYNKAHILLDQVYAYDQGYNALEAMTKGKIVFTGAENVALQHYNLKVNEVCINALPDVNDIVKQLSLLIESPNLIQDISIRAKAFIEKEHHYKTIASTYSKTWEV